MPGHLWSIELLNGSKYNIVTKSNNEDSAREAYRLSLGSSNDIYECKYVDFIHVVQQ